MSDVIGLLRSIGIQRDASRTYATRARWLEREAVALDRDGADTAAEYFGLALIAEHAAVAELDNPDDTGPQWCPCPSCWRYLTRLDDWEPIP